MHVQDTNNVVGLLQDEDEGGYNTSDEEFERQLEEASILKEAEKAEAASAPPRKRTKRGKGQGHRKKKTKMTNKFPNDPDAEGYEVRLVFHFLFGFLVLFLFIHMLFGALGVVDSNCSKNKVKCLQSGLPS